MNDSPKTQPPFTVSPDGAVSYGDRFPVGRKIKGDEPEEQDRLETVKKLLALGYAPEEIHLEYRVRARVGRSAKDKYVDIMLMPRTGNNTTSCMAPSYMVENKTPQEFKNTYHASFESQLFNIAQFMDGKPKYLCLAHRGQADIVDFRAYPSYKKWRAAGCPVAGNAFSKNHANPVKIPFANGLSNPLDKSVTKQQMENIRRDLHNVLWGGGRAQDTDVFNILTRLLIAKIHDEHNTAPGGVYQFQTFVDAGGRDESPDATVQRIEQLYQDALMSRINIAQAEAGQRKLSEKKSLKTNQLLYAINTLAPINFTEVGNSIQDAHDILGDFYQQIMRTGHKQEKGQFFTHPSIANFMADAVGLKELTADRIKKGEDAPVVIDPSGGSMTFLLCAMKKMADTFRELQSGATLTTAAKAALEKYTPKHRPNSWAERHCFGLEVNEDLGLAAQANMVLHSDGASAILTGRDAGDGLVAFSSYPAKAALLRHFAPHADGYSKPVNENFDVILTNPPFSLKEYIDEHSTQELRENFELAHTNAPSEALFIERWFQLLKPGGRLAAILPNSIFDSQSDKYLHARMFMFRHFTVRAIISLPTHAFAPYTPTKTCIVVAHKKTGIAPEKEVAQLKAVVENNGPILFASVEHIGYRRKARKEYPDKNALSGGADSVLHAVKHSASQQPPRRINMVKRIDPKDAILSGKTRVDPEHVIYQSALKNPAPASNWLHARFPDACAPTDIAAPFNYAEIGDVDGNGQVAPRRIDRLPAGDETPGDIEDDEKTRQVITKIMSGKIARATTPLVLLPKTRPHLGKYALLLPPVDFYYTTDFIEIRPAGKLLEFFADHTQATKALYVLLRTTLFPWLVAMEKWGKSYPTIDPRDINDSFVDASVMPSKNDALKLPPRADEVLGLIAQLKDVKGRLSKILKPHEGSP